MKMTSEKIDEKLQILNDLYKAGRKTDCACITYKRVDEGLIEVLCYGVNLHLPFQECVLVGENNPWLWELSIVPTYTDKECMPIVDAYILPALNREIEKETNYVNTYKETLDKEVKFVALLVLSHIFAYLYVENAPKSLSYYLSCTDIMFFIGKVPEFEIFITPAMVEECIQSTVSLFGYKEVDNKLLKMK